MSNQDEDNVQELLAKLELAIRTQVEREMKETDVRVSTQKSRLYKFRCWLVYGHLDSGKGSCLRCGKKLDNPTLQSNAKPKL